MAGAVEISFRDDERRGPEVSQGSLQVDGTSLPLRHTTITAIVAGPVADVVVEQTFFNDRAEAIEAIYLFPLPAEASVYRLRFFIGKRVVTGVVKSRAEARHDYEAALAEGRAATLLEEERPALFSLAIGNLAPNTAIRVELAYQELVPFDDGRWRFVVPMTAPPRYDDAPVANGVVAPRARVSGRAPDVDVTVHFPSATAGLVRELRSTSHFVSIDAHPEGGTRVRLGGAPDTALANGDFALDWQASDEGVRPWLFVERTRGEPGTFLLSLTPSLPQTPRPTSGAEMKAIRCGNCGAPIRDLAAIREIPGLGPVVPCAHCHAVLTPGTDVITRAARPKDVLVLVDRSASMRGSEDLAARAVAQLLSALDAADAVQVVVFDHERIALQGDARRFFAATPEVATEAAALLRAHPARGGSEIEDALGLSAKIPAREGRSRVVVLLSDVAVGNEGRLIGKVPELLSPGAKLFVLGLGDRLDRRLAARLARAGGGAAENGVTEETLARLLRRVTSAGPVLTDIALFWEGASMSDLEPGAPGTTRIPDLYGGEAVRVLGRFGAAGGSRLVITARTSDGRPFRQELAVDLPEEGHDARGLGRAWARRRLERLAERDEGDDDAEGLALGLAWSLVGRWTSLVAEDSEISVAKKRARQGVLTLNGAQVLVLDGSRQTIGRGGDLKLLDDPRVSRLHAEIVFGGEHFVLRDLASTNGTYVNGVGAREKTLIPGARIGIGKYEIHFDLMPDEFAYVPTRRGVDASSGKGGRRAAVVVPEMRAERLGAPMVMPGPARAMAPAPAAPGMMSAPPPRAAMGASPPMMGLSPGAARHAYVGAPQAGAPGPLPHAPVKSLASEPYPEHELTWLRDRIAGALDLVFLIDATSSMKPFIDEVRARLSELVTAVRAAPLCKSLHIGIVAYRDHPPQEHSFVTRTTSLTEDAAAIDTAIRALDARGGGDGPEAVTDGLFDAVRLDWRPDAARAVVWFGDAPPHGVEPTGDGFPDGCPCGHHWFTQAESCREMGITFYCVGCLPALRSYVGAEEVFRTVARTTRGMFLPLREAELLVPLIASAAESALDGQRLDVFVETLCRDHAAILEAADDDERVRWITQRLQHDGVRARDITSSPKPDAESALVFRAVTATDVRASLGRLQSFARRSSVDTIAFA